MDNKKADRLQKRKEYRKNNIEKIKESSRLYREKNAEALKEKILCVCGRYVSYSNRAVHERSNIHKNNL
jgi:hypothetical protein